MELSYLCTLIPDWIVSKTDKIKEKIDNAKSEEEVKSILENVKGGAEEAGLILDDEDLDKVAGGVLYHLPNE